MRTCTLGGKSHTVAFYASISLMECKYIALVDEVYMTFRWHKAVS